MDPKFKADLTSRFDAADKQLDAALDRAHECMDEAAVEASRFKRQQAQPSSKTRFAIRAFSETQIEVEVQHPETLKKVTRIFKERRVLARTQVLSPEQLRAKLHEFRENGSLTNEEINRLSDSEITLAAQQAKQPSPSGNGTVEA